MAVCLGIASAGTAGLYAPLHAALLKLPFVLKALIGPDDVRHPIPADYVLIKPLPRVSGRVGINHSNFNPLAEAIDANDD